MNKHQLTQFLQNTRVINTAQAAEIAAPFVPKTLKKDDFLLQAGWVSDDYFFLETGLLRAFAYDVAGHDISTGFHTQGRVVFEVASFFQRTSSQEYIQALTDCTGWAISFAQLNALFHSRPEFREFGRSLLVSGFAALKTRMLAMITDTASQRYEYLLRASPDLLQHVPLRHLATYLGVTDTSLSRIRKG